jgi:hypothetical protein
MIREIIEPTEETYILHIPREYIHKKIKIMMLPIDESTHSETNGSTEQILNATSGMLSSKSIDPLK